MARMPRNRHSTNTEIFIHSDPRIPRVQNGMEVVRLTKPMEPMNMAFPSEGRCVTNIDRGHIELRRFRTSFHVPMDLVQESAMQSDAMITETGFRIAIENGFRHVCSMSNSQFEIDQSIESGHKMIIDSCRMVEQYEANLILLDVAWWAVYKEDVDNVGKHLFEDNVRTLIGSGFDVRSIPFRGRVDELEERRRYEQGFNRYDAEMRYSYGNTQDWRLGVNPELTMDFGMYPSEKKYNDDAEEVAHELLKSMINKKEFERYKLEDFVEVKGTYGRTYFVKKGEMMEVKQKRMGKTKRYRLCIEPKHRGTICPTDEVIAKIKLIKASEKKLHEKANRFDN